MYYFFVNVSLYASSYSLFFDLIFVCRMKIEVTDIFIKLIFYIFRFKDDFIA